MTECTFCLADATIILNLYEMPVAGKIGQLTLCEAHSKKLRYFICGIT